MKGWVQLGWQERFTLRRWLWLAFRHPRNLRVCGPDTGMFVWQGARRLPGYRLADRVARRFERVMLPDRWKLVNARGHFEAHRWFERWPP